MTRVLRRLAVVYIVFLLGFAFISNSVALLLTTYLHAGWANYLDEIVFVGFLLIVAANVLAHRSLRLSWSYSAVGAFLVFGLVSTFVNAVPWQTALLGALQAFKPVVVFGAAYTLALKADDEDLFLVWFDRLMVGLVVAAFTYSLVFEWILGNNPMPAIAAMMETPRLGFMAARSFLGHPGGLGNIMLLASVYHFGRWLPESHVRWRLALALLAGIVMYSALRLKAMFAFPFLILLVYLLNRWTERKLSWKTAKRAGVILGIGLVNLAILGALLVNIWYPRIVIGLDALGNGPRGELPSPRRAMLDGAIAINKEHGGLGAGFGMFGSPASARYHYSPLYEQFGISSLPFSSPDNPAYIMDQWWAWFLGETGVGGFLSFLVFLAWITWDIVKLIRSRGPTNPRYLAMASLAVAALVYGVATGYVTSFLSGPSTSYLTMCLAGLSLAFGESVDPADRRRGSG